MSNKKINANFEKNISKSYSFSTNNKNQSFQLKKVADVQLLEDNSSNEIVYQKNEPTNSAKVRMETAKLN